jgi:drug/metabolite transporter (DMT)-like permease
VLSAFYTAIFLVLAGLNGRRYWRFLTASSNRRATTFAAAAVLVGTIIGDVLAWKAISMARVDQAPLVSAVLHTAPLFAVVLLYVFLGRRATPLTLVGVALAVGGCALMAISTP